MSTFKRCISLLLVMFILVGVFSPAAQAAPVEETASVNTDNVTIEGTNGFGNLLSQEITKNQEKSETAEAEYPSGYTVTDLEIEGKTATVTYDTMEDATLVVALYTEDGMQMVTSTTATVTPDATEASLTFEGEIPEFFLASAYLLDQYDYSPLCASYDTPMYTREMQELLDSTVNDYDPEKVLNLDADETTNFAVYADSTIIIEAAEGVNTVVSVNNETATYVIENVDEQISSLMKGDVFSYFYGDHEILIIKVDTIVVDGSTAIIIGTELEMEEVFSHVKIEGDCDTSEAQVDTSVAHEGITYIGNSRNSNLSTMNEGGTEFGKELAFTLDMTILGDDTTSINLSGNLNLGASVSVSYYITTSYQQVELQLGTVIGGNLTVSGKLGGTFSLAKLKFPIIAGMLEVGLEPGIAVEFEGALAIEYSHSVSHWVMVSHGSDGFYSDYRYISEEPHIAAELEGRVFIGLSLAPLIDIASGMLVKLELELQAGFEATLAMRSDEAAHGIRHSCLECYSGDISFVAKVLPSLILLNWDRLEFSAEFSKTIKLCDIYRSSVVGGIRFGTCPYQEYRVTVHTKGEDGFSASSVEISGNGASWGRTNDYGTLEVYLPAGHYKLAAEKDGGVTNEEIYITAPSKVTITLGKGASVNTTPGEGLDISEYLKYLESETITDNSSLVYATTYLEELDIAASDRYTGNQGDSFINVLGTRHGTTDIYGNVMEHGLEAWIARWNFKKEISWAWVEYDLAEKYTNLLGKVTVIADCYNKSTFDTTIEIIGDGNTLYSLKLYPEMEPLSIDVDVSGVSTLRIYVYDNQASKGGTAFGLWDFRVINHSITEDVETGTAIADGYCGENLTWTLSSSGLLTISGTGTMSNYSYYASSSSAPWYSYRSQIKNVIIENGVTTIGDYAFYSCDALTSVAMPSSITTINNSAFDSCSSLISVTIPDSVSHIGELAFAYCQSLPSVTIPNSVIYTGGGVFGYCQNLTSVTIPNSITFISAHTFSHCDKLTSVSIPDSVTSIGMQAFEYCHSLTSVTIPDSVTSIGNHAFHYCDILTSVNFEGNAPTINANAFRNVTATAYYPADNTTWTDDVMQDYGGTITWIPSTPNSGNGLIRELVQVSVPEPDVEIEAIYGGKYDTEVTDTYTLKTASFTDLVPGEQYVLLAMKSIETEDLLVTDNLLFIDQAVALEDGTLVFEYVQRMPTDISYVLVCGASNKNLQDAVVSFPEMTEDGELHVIAPAVIFDGKTLTEGLDYVINGCVDYTEAGEYVCYIRGIRNYTGQVECTYTVVEHQHSFTCYVSDGNAICTEDGTKTAKCDHCDATDTVPDAGSALGHNMCGWETTVPATCTENGEEQRVCSRCDHSESRTVEAAGHSFGSWIVIQEPTTTEDGLEERGCTRCGNTEQRSIAKLENPFTDVKSGSFYYEPVMWAIENGITNGTSATTFGPNDQCMRAHVVTFLWRAVGSPEPTRTDNPFVDVKPGDFYYKPVLWALENGITSGMDATHFGPTAYCNRAQVVTFLYRTMGSPELESAENPFTDVAKGSFYEKPVLWAVQNGITNGLSATAFGPNAICNRAQIVTFLYRAFVNE